MKKGSLILALLLLGFFFAGCDDFAKVEETYEYQQAKQVLGSGVQYVGEKATDFVQNNEEVQKGLELVNQKVDATKEQAAVLAEQAKAEAIKQYDQLKNDAKEQMKNSVNKKIDQLFE